MDFKQSIFFGKVFHASKTIIKIICTKKNKKKRDNGEREGGGVSHKKVGTSD